MPANTKMVRVVSLFSRSVLANHENARLHRLPSENWGRTAIPAPLLRPNQLKSVLYDLLSASIHEIDPNNETAEQLDD